jgi:hypothetical protein
MKHFKHSLTAIITTIITATIAGLFSLLKSSDGMACVDNSKNIMGSQVFIISGQIICPNKARTSSGK